MTLPTSPTPIATRKVLAMESSHRALGFNTCAVQHLLSLKAPDQEFKLQLVLHDDGTPLRGRLGFAPCGRMIRVSSFSETDVWVALVYSSHLQKGEFEKTYPDEAAVMPENLDLPLCAFLACCLVEQHDTLACGRAYPNLSSRVAFDQALDIL